MAVFSKVEVLGCGIELGTMMHMFLLFVRVIKRSRQGKQKTWINIAFYPFVGILNTFSLTDILLKLHNIDLKVH